MRVPLGGERWRGDRQGPMAVPPDGGGSAGFDIVLRPPGRCWAAGRSGQAHVIVRDTTRAVDDYERSVVVAFNRCIHCRTALVSIGIAASVAAERRWFACLDPQAESFVLGD